MAAIRLGLVKTMILKEFAQAGRYIRLTVSGGCFGISA